MTIVAFLFAATCAFFGGRGAFGESECADLGWFVQRDDVGEVSGLLYSGRGGFVG